MLLPGPEALQLAIFLGWKLHGMRGGIVAGLGFILPAIVLLFALSYLYVMHGSLPWVAGLLYGLQAAVVALVLQALVRIGRRALRTPLHGRARAWRVPRAGVRARAVPPRAAGGGVYRRLLPRATPLPAPNAAAPRPASGAQSRQGRRWWASCSGCCRCSP